LNYLKSRRKTKLPNQVWVWTPKKKASVLSPTQKIFGETTLKPLSNIIANIKKTPSLLKSGVGGLKRKTFGTRQKPKTILKITKADDISIVGRWTPAAAERSALSYLKSRKPKPTKPTPQITVSTPKKQVLKLSSSQKMFGRKGYQKPKKPFVIPGLLYDPVRVKKKAVPQKLELIYETTEKPLKPQYEFKTPVKILYLPKMGDVPKITSGKPAYPSTRYKPPSIKSGSHLSTVTPTLIKLKHEYGTGFKQTPIITTKLTTKLVSKQRTKQTPRPLFKPVLAIKPAQWLIPKTKPRRYTKKQVLKLKFKKPKRGSYKFKEITGVLLPSQMFGKDKRPKSPLSFGSSKRQKLSSSLITFRSWKK
jgi:hypothetical protein